MVQNLVIAKLSIFHSSIPYQLKSPKKLFIDTLEGNMLDMLGVDACDVTSSL